MKNSIKNAIQCLTIIITLAWTSSIGASQNIVIKHNKIDSPKEEYQFGLLKLALSYSDKRYQFDESNTYLTQQKLMSELDRNKISVAWVGNVKNTVGFSQVIKVEIRRCH